MGDHPYYTFGLPPPTAWPTPSPAPQQLPHQPATGAELTCAYCEGTIEFGHQAVQIHHGVVVHGKRDGSPEVENFHNSAGDVVLHIECGPGWLTENVDGTFAEELLENQSGGSCVSCGVDIEDYCVDCHDKLLGDGG